MVTISHTFPSLLVDINEIKISFFHSFLFVIFLWTSFLNVSLFLYRCYAVKCHIGFFYGQSIVEYVCSVFKCVFLLNVFFKKQKERRLSHGVEEGRQGIPVYVLNIRTKRVLLRFSSFIFRVLQY